MCISVAVNGGMFDNNGFQLPIQNGDLVISTEFDLDSQFATKLATEATAYMYAPGGFVATPSPQDPDSTGSLGS